MSEPDPARIAAHAGSSFVALLPPVGSYMKLGKWKHTPSVSSNGDVLALPVFGSIRNNHRKRHSSFVSFAPWFTLQVACCATGAVSAGGLPSATGSPTPFAGLVASVSSGAHRRVQSTCELPVASKKNATK